MSPTDTAEPPASDPKVEKPEPSDEGQSVIDVFVERVDEAETLTGRIEAALADDAERDALIRKIEETTSDATAAKLAEKLAKVESRLRVRDIRQAKDEADREDAIEAALALLNPARAEARRMIDAATSTARDMADRTLAQATGVEPYQDALGAAGEYVGVLPAFTRAARHQAALAGFFVSGDRLANLARIRDGLVEIVADLPTLTAEAEATAKAAEAFKSAIGA